MNCQFSFMPHVAYPIFLCIFFLKRATLVIHLAPEMKSIFLCFASSPHPFHPSPCQYPENGIMMYYQCLAYSISTTAFICLYINIIYSNALSNIFMHSWATYAAAPKINEPSNYFQKRLLITVLLLTALPLTPFSLGGRSVGVTFFRFCCVLVLVDFWLLSAFGFF